jgi:hypothetical protein
MSLTIIVKGGSRKRVPRSEQERELRGEGWGGTMDDEQLDKARHLEKKAKDQTGAKTPFFALKDVDEVK